MRKVLTAVAAAALIGVTALASSSPAEAWGRWGWGWGPGPFWGGVAAGAVVGGAIAASPYYYRPYYPYGYYGYGPGYGYGIDAGRYGMDMLGSVRASKHAIGTLVSKSAPTRGLTALASGGKVRAPNFRQRSPI